MRITLLCIGLALTLAITGCAQLVQERAQTQVREGKYEAALHTLEEGLQRYPENALLRSGLIVTRADAVSRLSAEAAQAQSAAKFDQAEELLKRAADIEPRNERILTQLEELASERRWRPTLDAATKLMTEGKSAQALRVLEPLLRAVPRHAAGLSLKRRLEAAVRVEDTGGGRIRLAETRPITLDFRNAPLSTVLDAVTRGSGVNFILDKDVRQDARVTVYLRSAAVEDAIDLLVGAHQLARRIVDARTVLIYPNTPEKQREHQEQVVRVFHLGNAEAKVTAQLLRSMLRLKEVFVDDRSNLIAIRESPDVVAMAERLVALHDAGDAEVMLEVEVLEVKSSRLTELGVAVPNGLTLTPLAATGGSLTVQGLKDLNASTIGVSFGGVTLNLRREIGDFNILANPRIRTKNREKARILIGDRYPVVNTTTSATTALISESISYLDVGLKLDVEPYVSFDDEVTIKLGLEVSAISGTVQTAGGSVAYQVGTRNANTTLRLHDGETQVLAGLISKDDRTNASRIPGLGDLPVAGRLFSSQKDEFQRTELVLAITPRVLRNAPLPDLSEARLWVGTENSPHLREIPQADQAPARTAANGTTASEARPTSRAAPLQAQPANGSALVTGTATPSPPDAVEEAESARLAWRGPVAVKPGEVFTVPLHLVTSTALRGAIAEIEFPSQLLDVVEVTEGSFFKQGGGQTSFTQNVASAQGKLTIGILRTDAAGASGDAPFAELRLRAKAAGIAELKVLSLRPVGLGGAAPSARLSTFRVTVQ